MEQSKKEGKIMRAVRYNSYGGGAAGLKVIISSIHIFARVFLFCEFDFHYGDVFSSLALELVA